MQGGDGWMRKRDIVPSGHVPLRRDPLDLVPRILSYLRKTYEPGPGVDPREHHASQLSIAKEIARGERVMSQDLKDYLARKVF